MGGCGAAAKLGGGGRRIKDELRETLTLVEDKAWKGPIGRGTGSIKSRFRLT